MSKVHKMNCFFKIWKSSAFLCIDPSSRLSTLPLSLQAQIRSIARKGLNNLELDILRDLDDCLTQSGTPKSQDKMAIWASLWQLMLTYRELIIGTKAYLYRAASFGAEHIRGKWDGDRRDKLNAD